MTLSQLMYFKTVAELGNIKLAAKSLFISPPALSTTISSLEKELGMSLFDRASNRIFLNEQGKIFLRYVNQIINNLDCAKMELQQSLKDSEQNIRIAVTTSNIWTPMISAFAFVYPHIMLSFTTLKLSQLHNLNISRLHTFILAERNDFYAADMESKCLFEEKPIAIINPDHPYANKTMVELSDLADEILFLPMADQSLNKRIKEMFYTNQIPLKHTHECADYVCKSMVAEGRGISFATAHISRASSDNLHYVPINAPGCHWEQHLYWNKNRVLTSKETQFKDFVLNMYQNRAGYR